MATITSTPSLTLRALLSRAASRAALDRSALFIAGLTPAAKALAAVVSARTSKEATLLVAPSDKDVEQLVEDARFFYGALEGASEAAVDRAILPLPSLQVDPYRGMTPHFRVAAARARALFGAASGEARLIVASAAALLPRLSPPERLLQASLEIRSGTRIEPQDLADLLVDAGFTREDPVEEHGSFTIRGGIVDVFPAADAEPVRIEFVGDMVETLRRYDPATQRSTGGTDQRLIVPVRGRFDPEDDAVSIVDYLSAAYGVKLLISEYEQVEQQAPKLREQLEHSHADAAARGHVVAAPPEAAFVSWDELEPRAAAARRLDELAIDEGGPEGPPLRSGSVDPVEADLQVRLGHTHHIRCQPALE